MVGVGGTITAADLMEILIKKRRHWFVVVVHSNCEMDIIFLSAAKTVLYPQLGMHN